MKRWFLLFALIFGLVAGPAFAVVSTKDDGIYSGDAVHLDFEDTFDVNSATGDDSTKRIKFNAAFSEKTLQFSPAEFMLFFNNPDAGAVETYTPLTTSTTPGFAITDSTVTGFIEWADGEDTKVQKKFRVPRDYKSGGSFRLLLGRSGGTDTPPSLDFEVFVDRTATAEDTSATDQTSVLVATSVQGGSPEEKTLTVTTDFASLAAGDYITVNFWRSDADSPASTESLQLWWAEFVYSTTD